MKKKKIKEMILDPKNLWIADTNACTTYLEEGIVKVVGSHPFRKEVAVIYVGDYFIELASIDEKIHLSRCYKLPIKPTKELEEYVDLDTIKQFPFEEWASTNNVTVESLQEMDTVRQIKKYLKKESK